MVHLLLTNPLSFLISMGFVAGSILGYTAFVYGIPKLTELGARLWRGEKSKNGYVLIDGEWYPASYDVEFGETMKSINSHLHENKEEQ